MLDQPCRQAFEQHVKYNLTYQAGFFECNCNSRWAYDFVCRLQDHLSIPHSKSRDIEAHSIHL